VKASGRAIRYRPFATSDNTFPIVDWRSIGLGEHASGAPRRKRPSCAIRLSDGTLVANPDVPPTKCAEHAGLSDVMATCWFAAFAANVKPGGTFVVSATRPRLLGVFVQRGEWELGKSSR